MTARMAMVVGQKGSGKSVWAAYRVAYVHKRFPNRPIISNTHMEALGAVYYPSILKWMALKLKHKNFQKVEVIADEVSIAEELESRGSFARGSIPPTRLIALSRKINVNIWLISQLASQVDKRPQWLADLWVWATCQYDYNGKPVRFDYQIFDDSLPPRKINDLTIWGDVARDHLFDRFNSEEVPGYDELVAQFENYWGLDDDDDKQFFQTMGLEQPDPLGKPKETADVIHWKWVKEGEIIRWHEKTWVVESRIYELAINKYKYHLVEA